MTGNAAIPKLLYGTAWKEERTEALTTLALEDALLGGFVELLCSPPAHVVGQPHLTVSQSEDGFEKVMQAVTLTLAWAMEQPIEEIVVALEIHRQPIAQT